MMSRILTWTCIVAALGLARAAQPEFCRLPSNAGPCGAELIRYYFDTATQQCQQFGYGGCQGNANNFRTLSQCRAACICTQEVDEGYNYNCPNPGHLSYYFDATGSICQRFQYGGCGGNQNRFGSAQNCMDACATSFCFLPPDPGPCEAAMPRYFYNKNSQSCEPFSYGGCEGNANRFTSLNDCNERCTARINAEFRDGQQSTATVTNICLMPKQIGTCSEHFSRFFYDPTSNSCRSFVYSGCQGNANNFATEQDCHERCIQNQGQNRQVSGSGRSEVTREVCQLPPDMGLCRDYRSTFYFDSASKECRKFVYGGCQGNRNRFVSAQECLQRCQRFFMPTSATSLPDSTAPGGVPGYNGLCPVDSISATVDRIRSLHGLPPLFSNGPCNIPAPRLDRCLLPAQTGGCEGGFRRFYYDVQTSSCREFMYGGCDGNDNRFLTLTECQEACVATPAVNEDICQLPPTPGPCDGMYPKFYYNAQTGECQGFIYGGCLGNENRFETRAQCQERCAQTEDICKLPPETGPCNNPLPRYFYNSTSGRCQDFVYGGCQGNENRFDTLAQCERRCNSVPSRCTLHSDSGPCEAFVPRYFYNVASGNCEQFVYGGCQGNDNRFSTMLECENACVSRQRDFTAICSLPVDVGPCRAAFTRFYYNVISGRCEQFFYGGCQGNENRFETLEECDRKCRDVQTDRCSLPSDKGLCQGVYHKFFYNSQTGRCEEFIYGGCQGNENRFDSEQECEEACHATQERSQEVCFLPPQSGPCRASFSRYFYNANSGRCEEFMYGGCQGNDNNFLSEAECERTCSSASPSPTPQVVQDVCNLVPDAGPCRARFSRYFYNVSSSRCDEFIYGGCEGNQNRFDTREECEQNCSVVQSRSQEVCLLPPQPGSCRASFSRYFYNSSSGRCEQFMYGGCQGNDNRFYTELECKQVCSELQSRSQDVCLLPPISGPCYAYFQRYFYNVSSGQCEEFVYGGCQGNENRFDSQSECQQVCSAVRKSQDVCLLTPQIGPCRASFSRYFYNSSSGRCEEFMYGGCQGNENRFYSEQECEQVCSGLQRKSQDVCLLPPQTGSCRASFSRYFYNANSGRCEEFMYGGCQGNDNNFLSEAECERTCSSASPSPTPQVVQDVCNLLPDAGSCRARFSRYFYNVSSSRCDEFIYGGCEGNQNRFDTREECEQNCSVVQSRSQEVCLLPPQPGSCRASFSRYFYNSSSGRCEQFMYGGCQGNDNNFFTASECEQVCSQVQQPKSQDVCLLRPQTGPCRASFPRYFYNSSSGRCEEFMYGGCQGNDNRFYTEMECEQVCSGVQSRSEDICQLIPHPGPCRASFQRFFYNASSGRCEQFLYGGCQGNENNFYSEAECEMTCSSASPSPTPRDVQDVCNLLPDAGPCRARFSRYFYNVSSSRCDEFIYGGCEGNQNRFNTQQECDQACSEVQPRSPQDICRLTPHPGPCRASFSRYFYNSSSGRCEEFMYGGCQGNENRFYTEQECEQVCSEVQRKSQEVCFLPPQIGPCRASFSRYFYNANSGRCEEFMYGGCQGNDNNFLSEAECERTCSSASPSPTPQVVQDVCNLVPDAGPCRARFSRYFYNVSSSRCDEFIYGGCEGNQNRFDTITDCQNACYIQSSIERTGDEICRLPPETGPCKASIPQFFYNSTSGKCEEFIYGGCQGNENRFDSPTACESSCNSQQPSTIRIYRDICSLPPDYGPCNTPQTRFYFNPASDRCEQFAYSGCGGNENRFLSMSACTEKCRAARPERCFQSLDPGSCQGYYPKYFFNGQSGRCEKFVYGGCQGNDNRFDSQQECEQICYTALPKSQDACLLPPESGPCRASIPQFFHNATSGRCEEFMFGGCRGNDNRFATMSHCEATCRSESPVEVPATCQLPVNPGPCHATFTRFYYNVTSGLCEKFVYGGCDGNYNNYNSISECQSHCLDKPLDLCYQSPDTGPCDGVFPSYFYNATSGLCESFEYGGCDGNENRFDNRTDCEQSCINTPVPK